MAIFTYSADELNQVFQNAEMYKDAEFPLVCGLFRYLDSFSYRKATEEQKANFVFTDPKESLKKLLSGGMVLKKTPDIELREIFLKVLSMPKFREYGFGSREDIDAKLKTLDMEYTYLQISDIQPTKLSGVRKKFIGREQAKHVQEVLRNQQLGLPVHYQDRFSDWFNTFNYNEPSMLFYYKSNTVPVDKLVQNETILKPVKILQVIYPEISKDKLSVVSGYIADALKERAQEIQSTYDLKEWEVPSEIYNARHASGLNSCMKNMDEVDPVSNECKTNTFELYDDLPNTTILRCREKGVIAGRALLHRKVTNMDSGETLDVMDRIYAASSDIMAAFKIWAKQNGFARKLEQKLNEDYYVLPDSSIVHLPHLRIDTIGIYEHQYEKVPYVDTFAYHYTAEPEYLYSWMMKDEKGERDSKMGDVHFLDSTTGYDDEAFFTHTTGKRCCHCDEPIRDDENYEEVNGEYYCQDCFNDHYAYCEQCGDLLCTDSDEAVYIEDRGIVCQYCADRYYTKCEICGEYHLPKEMEEYYDERGNESWVCPECQSNNYRCTQCDCCNTYVHRNYTHTCFTEKGEQVWCDHCIREKATWCRDCEEWFPKAEGYQTDSGVWYCAKCSEEED